MRMPTHDATGKQIHDFLVTMTKGGDDYGYVLKKDRVNAQFKSDGNRFQAINGGLKVVNLRQLCVTMDLPYSLESCNALCYALDLKD